MKAIKTLRQAVGRWRPRDSEPRRPNAAWLARVERRLDEGDVLTSAELVLVREFIASLEPAR